jgi:hypothetical protein
MVKRTLIKKNDSNIRKIIFKSNDVSIYEDLENIYTFDIDKTLYTMDILEAISYLIKNKNIHNEKFWSLEIREDMNNFIKPINSLYWLSGGDDFWNECNFKWVENYELYEKKFQKKLYDIVENSKTLNDIKNNLMKDFNLDVFYEFALFTKLKKEII